MILPWRKKKSNEEVEEELKEKCRKEVMSMIEQESNAIRDKALNDSKNLVFTMKELYNTNNAFSMKVQGKHPVTGGTTVIYFKDDKYEKLKDAKYILQCILFGKQNDDVDEFIERASTKVVKGYCNQISVHGRDVQGDSLEYEMNFKTQHQLFGFLKTGIFDMDNPDHNEYLTVQLWEG